MDCQRCAVRERDSANFRQMLCYTGAFAIGYYVLVAVGGHSEAYGHRILPGIGYTGAVLCWGGMWASTVGSVYYGVAKLID